MARRSHPFPYRTRKLSFSAPMVVGTRVPVRVGRCQAHLKEQPEKVVLFCVSGQAPDLINRRKNSV